MTGSDLYQLTTKFLGGYEMDVDLFYQLVNMAKNSREMMRDWMKLRKIDRTITFASSDTYLSTKTLPDRFLRTYAFRDSYGNLSGPFIVTSAGQKIPLEPIKMEEAYEYKDSDGYYYIDLANNAICRTGTIAGTLHLPFLQGTEEITADTEWGLPPQQTYSALLAYDAAVEHKGGIDWDDVHANQVPYNQRMINTLSGNLSTWDSLLQHQQLGV